MCGAATDIVNNDTHTPFECIDDDKIRNDLKDLFRKSTAVIHPKIESSSSHFFKSALDESKDIVQSNINNMTTTEKNSNTSPLIPLVQRGK